MNTLDINTLKHDIKRIDQILVKKGNTLYTKENINIIYPNRYINRKLVEIGSTVKLLAVFAIITNDDKYATVSAPIMMNFTPNNLSEVMINGVIYNTMEFEADSIIVPDTNSIKNTNFIYDMFDEFYIKGKVPWFMEYVTLSRLLVESSKYTGSGVGDNPLGYEIITAIIAKDSKNKKVQYRHTDMKLNPAYTGLNSVYFSYDSTGAKLIGSYFKEGISSAVVNKEKKSTVVTDVLRS